MRRIRHGIASACVYFSLLGTGALAGSDAPSPENYLRRPYASAVVVGDYVYIDGGEVSQLENGKNNGNHPSYAVNGTISLPLTSSWTNQSATFKTIKKPAPSQDQQVIWSDPSTSSFYAWGGMTAWFGSPLENQVWKFAADGSGGGAWSKADPSSVVAFSSAARTVGSAFASVRGIGYSVGGLISKATDTSASGTDDSFAVQGLTTFDMGTGAWANGSSTGLGPYGTVVNSAMEYAPFGSKGLLVVLGGSVPPVGVVKKYDQLDWNNIYMMDIETKKWYNQAVTGSKPTKREKHCSVGVQGPNGTYDIFIYGGSQADSTASDVYVLSLPGFVMFKSPNSGTPRQDHACVRVGRNGTATTNRQMLSVGGTNGWLGFPKSLTDPDPWKQGLGIFDMTAMTWSSSYDPDAAPYDNPTVVKSWYADGGLDSVNWTNDDVKKLFVTSKGTSTSSGESSGGSSSTGTTGSGSSSSSSSNPSSSNSTGSTTNTGAIAGGVVGGVAALAILGLVAFLLLRRRKRAAAAQPANAFQLAGSESEKQQQQPQSGWYGPGKPGAQAWPSHEMPADGAGPAEVDGSWSQMFELPDHGAGGGGGGLAEQQQQQQQQQQYQAYNAAGSNTVSPSSERENWGHGLPESHHQR